MQLGFKGQGNHYKKLLLHKEPAFDTAVQWNDQEVTSQRIKLNLKLISFPNDACFSLHVTFTVSI